jgi:hypothetical protein
MKYVALFTNTARAFYLQRNGDGYGSEPSSGSFRRKSGIKRRDFSESFPSLWNLLHVGSITAPEERGCITLDRKQPGYLQRTFAEMEC